MSERCALIVVDVRNDFLRGGALAVPDGVIGSTAATRGCGRTTASRVRAAPADALDVDGAALIIRKGTRSGLDSCSAFVEGDGATPIGLAGHLRARSMSRVVVVGFAFDFCVSSTACDATRVGSVERARAEIMLAEIGVRAGGFSIDRPPCRAYGGWNRH